MSIYFNQTNITSGTSQFITRQEVIQGFSTLAGDLSGVNLSSFFLNPNPSFSSISMNATGTISGAASVSAQGSLGLSTVKFAYSQPNSQYNYVPGLQDQFGNYQVLATAANVVKTSSGSGQYHSQVLPTGINYVNTLGTIYPFAALNTTPMTLALTNVSSINGQNPTTAGTTFTNLTGSNLTTTGTLTSPQVVSVSSINGYAYNAQQVYTISSGGSSTLTANTPSVIYASLLGGTFLPNTYYLFNIQIIITNIGVTAYPLMVGVRLGGSSGQIVYCNNINLTAAGIPTTGAPINLCGIALTGTSTNTLEVIGLCVTGISITVSVGTSPANRLILKPLA